MSPTTRWPTSLLILSLLLLITTACSAAETAVPTAVVQVSHPTETFEHTPSATNTQYEPSPTWTLLPPTATFTPTHTSTSTITPTSEPASIVVNQDSACRIGPGLIYDIRTYLTEGALPILLGQDPANQWWFVEEPIHNTTCWVSDEVVSIQGDINSLPALTPEPTSTQAPAESQNEKGLKYFLISLNSGGPFGCGDGLVYFHSGKPITNNDEQNIKSALNALFKVKSKYIGDYYNPVHNAHLNVKSVTVDRASGFAEVFLAGSIPKPADVCEAKRVHDVVWGTVEQFSAVNKARIWVGNHKLGDLIAVGDR